MGYTVHEILQARILEWVAIPFSTGSSQLRDPTQVLRPKIPAFVPRRKNRTTQWTSPADATRKRVYCRLRKRVTLISWEAEHIEQQIGQAFYRQKTILSAYYIRVTKWLVTRLQSNPIGTNFPGYMFTKQSYWYNFSGFCSNLKQFYWYKRRGLLFKLKRPRAFQLSHGLLLGAYWLAGSRSPDGGGEFYHFTGNRNPSPGPLPAPAPAAPHNKTYFSASKTNKKNIRHVNYRHW